MAYGRNGIPGKVPPNSYVIYDVEVRISCDILGTDYRHKRSLLTACMLGDRGQPGESSAPFWSTRAFANV